MTRPSDSSGDHRVVVPAIVMLVLFAFGQTRWNEIQMKVNALAKRRQDALEEEFDGRPSPRQSDPQEKP